MRIKVLQHHIDEGTKTDPFSCAIALAVREQIPEASSVSVGSHITVWYDLPSGESERNVFDLPLGVDAFIIGFDKGDLVSPIEFDLDQECGSCC